VVVVVVSEVAGLEAVVVVVSDVLGLAAGATVSVFCSHATSSADAAKAQM
jgi:hypothetical protein